MKIRLFFLIVLSLMFAGCSVTPQASLGVDLRFSNGKLRLQPEAHIGVYGHP